jgi:hypothetical protein
VRCEWDCPGAGKEPRAETSRFALVASTRFIRQTVQAGLRRDNLKRTSRIDRAGSTEHPEPRKQPLSSAICFGKKSRDPVDSHHRRKPRRRLARESRPRAAPTTLPAVRPVEAGCRHSHMLTGTRLKSPAAGTTEYSSRGDVDIIRPSEILMNNQSHGESKNFQHRNLPVL